MANLDDMNKSLDDIIMKLEHILDLQAMAIENNVELQTRVAEQRDAPVHAGQKCPYCNGTKKVYAWFKWTRCPECKGTGISNRSAGG